jgi:hypothetical protein
MKLIVLLTIVTAGLAQEELPKAEPLVDLENLRKLWSTKAELVARFFNLLYLSSADADVPRNRTRSAPLVNQSFRRLNIFGLQAPPEAPPRDANGNPYLSKTSEGIPEILHFDRRPEANSGPNFFTVQPRTDQIISERRSDVSTFYPKLNFDGSFQSQLLQRQSFPRRGQPYEVTENVIETLPDGD